MYIYIYIYIHILISICLSSAYTHKYISLSLFIDGLCVYLLAKNIKYVHRYYSSTLTPFAFNVDILKCITRILTNRMSLTHHVYICMYIYICIYIYIYSVAYALFIAIFIFMVHFGICVGRYTLWQSMYFEGSRR